MLNSDDIVRESLEVQFRCHASPTDRDYAGTMRKKPINHSCGKNHFGSTEIMAERVIYHLRRRKPP